MKTAGIMKSIHPIVKSLFILFLLFPNVSLSAEVKEYPFQLKQSGTVKWLYRREKDAGHRKGLAEVINGIDSIYARLDERVRAGEQIVIFFDPAHGKLDDGRWQGGAATRRRSATGNPEEFYSIQLSRKMYRILDSNPRIRVESTEDYLRVLRGESDSYRNIPFTTTVRLAMEKKAFIIISEHLNNVSVFHKADGLSNLTGIHVTYNKWGRRYLRYIKNAYQGFLTLYNRLDASGFSRQYALALRDELTGRGMIANNWQKGAVGDDRFTYFSGYPISVIFESGFISNPREEKLLRDEAHQEKIVQGQYRALNRVLQESFGVSLEGNRTVRPRGKPSDRVELIKLSRIAVYYLGEGKTSDAIMTIRAMEKKYRKTEYDNHLDYYRNLVKILTQSEKYYRIGKAHTRKKHLRTARRYYLLARKKVIGIPVLTHYKNKYSRLAGIKKRSSSSSGRKTMDEIRERLSVDVQKAPMERKVLFALEKDQDLRQALRLALDPTEKVLDRMEEAMERAYEKKRARRSYYSKKRGRRVYYWKTIRSRVNFREGIYILDFSPDLKTVEAKRVSTVRLDPDKYQNQQYLKNSAFANGKRSRAR